MTTSARKILYEKRNQVAYITLNRPEVLNALDRDVHAGMRDALRDFQDDPEMRVVIMTGAGGRAFSAGMDLKDRSRRADAGEPVSQLAPSFTEMGILKPIIAAIDGYCVAGGLEVALQCDIRIATENSEFGLPEPRWCLTAGYGLHHLSRMVPLGEALYMQLTGRRIDAQRAYEIGLIQERLADRAALLAKADEIAEEIKLCAPLAVSAIKQVVYQGRDLPVPDSLALGAPLSAGVHASEDTLEGPLAYAEKRAPVWKSR